MSSKSDKEKLKQVQEKCQVILSQLLREEDNKYCEDCDAKGPRWASWNLGIFLCIRCAGIHRNLGVHISKVKSVNLDSWTPEQVACLQQMGNSRARAVYEANVPDNFRRPQTDSSLEAFVRSKYETKKFIAKEWVPPPMPKPSSEFEEEKKKTKDKKPKSSSHSGLEVPLPSSSGGKKSPSPSQSSTPDSQNAKPKAGAMIDLLGLNDPMPAIPPQATPTDDPFGSFLSATTSVATNGFASASTSDSPSRTAESGGADARGKSSSSGGDATSAVQSHSDQENLFAQMSNEQLLQKKGQQPLSKESIMSLYGQAPAGQQPSQQQQQQQSNKMMGMPAGAMFMGQPQQQQQQQQQANMFGVPGQMQQGFGAYGGVVPAGVHGNVAPGMVPPGLVSGVPQANVMGTNPFLVPGSLGAVGGGWFTGSTNPTSHPAFGQLQHQMASMSMGGPAFGNVTVPQSFVSGGVPQVFGGVPGQQQIIPPMPGAALGWAGQQPGQTLSTNLWQ